MANYSVLKAAVQAVIKTNGNQDITGANMQSTLISIINSLGTGYQFMGVATPSTSPGTPDYNVAYIGGAGTYANFGTSVTVPVGSICVFKYNGSWTKEQIALFAGIDDVPTASSTNLVRSGGIYSSINSATGYFICSTASATAAKTVTAPNYILETGGSIKIKFTSGNYASSVTLNINSKGAYPLYYKGNPVTEQNHWQMNDVLNVYFDGSIYWANDAETNKITTKYTDSLEINKAIRGVYVFDPNNELRTACPELYIYRIRKDEDGYLYETVFLNRSGTAYLFYSNKKISTSKNLQGFALRNTSVRIWILFNSEYVASDNTGDTWSKKGCCLDSFYDAKDFCVINELNNTTKFLDYGKSIAIFPFTNTLLNVLFLNCNKKYSISRVAIGTTLVRLIELESGTVYTASATSFSGNMTAIIDLSSIEGHKAYAYLYVDTTYPFDLGSLAIDLSYCVFNESVYHRDFLDLLELDVDEIVQSIQQQIDPIINSYSIIETQVENTLGNVDSELSDFGDRVSEVEDTLDSIGASNIATLYANILSNYQNLSAALNSETTDREADIAALVQDLSDSVSALETAIANKNTTIATGSIVLDMLSASLKAYIDASGGGTITNNPDEVTITENANGELAIKNIEKTASNQSGAMMVLDIPTTIPQHTKLYLTENINSDFTLPVGSKAIPFTGIPTGNITGGEPQWVHSSDIGMVADSSSYASQNANILVNLLNNNYKIAFDGKYYIGLEKLTEVPNLYLTGGELVFTNEYGFKVADGGSIVCKDVSFTSIYQEPTWMIDMQTEPVDGFYPEISFVGCQFKDCKVRLAFQDIDSDEYNFGIGKLNIRNCFIDCSGSFAVFENSIFWNECNIIGNRQINLSSAGFQIGWLNEYQHSVSSIKKGCTIVISDNYVSGVPTNLNYYDCFVVVECWRAVFMNNYIENIINIANSSNMGAATAYDSYISCQELYYNGNVVKNVMSFRTGENYPKPQCEIGKSKQIIDSTIKSIRKFENNSWVVDGDYIEALGADPSDLYAQLLYFADTIDTVVFVNNNIQMLGNSYLKGSPSSIPYKRLSFVGNNIEAHTISGNLLHIKDSVNLETIICNNTFSAKNGAVRIKRAFINNTQGVNENFIVKDNTYTYNGGCVTLPSKGSVDVEMLKPYSTPVGNEFYNYSNIPNQYSFIKCNQFCSVENNRYFAIYIDSQSNFNINIQKDKLYTENNVYMYISNINETYHINFVVGYVLNGENKKDIIKIKNSSGVFTLEHNNEVTQISDISSFYKHYAINDLGLYFGVKSEASSNSIYAFINNIDTVSKNDRWTNITMSLIKIS